MYKGYECKAYSNLSGAPNITHALRENQALKPIFLFRGDLQRYSHKRNTSLQKHVPATIRTEPLSCLHVFSTIMKFFRKVCF